MKNESALEDPIMYCFKKLTNLSTTLQQGLKKNQERLEIKRIVLKIKYIIKRFKYRYV